MIDGERKGNGSSHLEALLVRVGDGSLAAVGESVTGEAQRHAQLAVLLLELVVGGALVLCTLCTHNKIIILPHYHCSLLTSAHLPVPDQFVAGEDQVDLGLGRPVPHRHLTIHFRQPGCVSEILEHKVCIEFR